ncbi:hypothetical protein D3C72_2354070 [compost metagenome]
MPLPAAMLTPMLPSTSLSELLRVAELTTGLAKVTLLVKVTLAARLWLPTSSMELLASWVSFFSALAEALAS